MVTAKDVAMEFERDDEDFSRDYMLEEARADIEEEFGDEIARNVQLTTLRLAALAAHEETIELAERALAKAEERLGASAWDEAVFHAARGIDGYATEVFVKPFRALALRPFREGLPHVRIVDTIISEATGLESGSKFVRVGFAATADAKETERLVGMLRGFLHEGNVGSGWPVRNTTLHTLSDPSEAAAKAFVAESASLLAAISAPLKAQAERAVESRQLAKERAAEAREYKSPF